MKRRRKKYRSGLGITPASGQRQQLEVVPANSTDVTLRQNQSALNETDKKVIRYAIYTGGALLVSSVTFFLVRSHLRKKKRLKVEKESLTDNSPENFAKRFQMAFDNDGLWGTNVEAVRKIFVQIPSKEIYDKTAIKYWELTGKKKLLNEDLSDELTTTELYEMQSILNAKPDKTGQPSSAQQAAKQAISYARRLNAAVHYTVLGFPSTDEDAIRQVVTDVPTKKMWALTEAAYRMEYGAELADELDGDLGLFDFSWRDMIKKKPLG